MIESGIAELSIGFKPLKAPRMNDHGGYTYPLVRVHEVSLVAVGCSFGSGIGGKHMKCACSTSKGERRYLVDPAMVAKALGETIRAATRAAICEAAGRFDSTDADLAAVVAKARGHGAAAVEAVLRRFGGTVEEPARRELAESPTAELLRRQKDAVVEAHAARAAADQTREAGQAIRAELVRMKVL